MSDALRVLVVDDSRDAADSMAEVLDLLGYTAQAIYDGREIVARLKSFAPQVVLLDLSMPGLDGFGTLALLRSVPVAAPVHVVAMTGHGRPDDIARSLAAGFDTHLTKPVELDDLQALLDSLTPAGG